MGQHRQLQPVMGGKHHQFNTAAPMRKFLIWSFGILVPFLVLFSIFPSGASLYKPSYNRIVVSQLQVPASRVQSGFHEPKLSSPDKTPSTSGDDDDGDDMDSDKQSNASMTTGEAFSGDASATTGDALTIGKPDRPATEKQSKSKEKKVSTSIVEVDQSSTTKAKKQNEGEKTESLRTDNEGDHLLLKLQKESNEAEEKKSSDVDDSFSTNAKKHSVEDEGDDLSASKGKKKNDGEEPKASSNGEEELDALKKEKKQNDGDESDRQSKLKAKKKKDEEEPEASSIDVELDLPLKEKKEKAKKNEDGDEPEVSSINAELDVYSKKAEKQQDGDEGDHLSTWKTKKQNDGDGTRPSDMEDGLDLPPKKAKKQKDGDEGDIQSTKKHYVEDETEALSGIAEELDIPPKKAKKKISTEGYTPEDNANLIEQEFDETNGEPNAETEAKKKKKKKNNDDFNADKESTKKENTPQHAEVMPELALYEEFSISGKNKANHENVDEPTADIQIKKSTKKSKKPDELSETVDEEEDSKEQKDHSDEEEENFSFSGKEGSFDEEFTSYHSKQSLRKPKNISKQEELEIDELMGDAEEDVSFSGKKSSPKQKRKKVEDSPDEDAFTQEGKISDESHSDTKVEKVDPSDHESHMLFLKQADDDAFLSESTDVNKKKRRKRAKDILLEDMEDRDQDGMMEGAEVQEEYSNVHMKHDKDMDSAEDSPYIIPSPRDDEDEAALETTNKVEPSKKSMLSGTCRYFKGRWTMDPSYAPYMDSSCPWKSIKDEQTCKTTKKMNSWRWQPSECNMDRFKAKAFLKLMRGKSIAFVGDKMVKAQMKSLVCLLAQVEIPSLIYNDKANQSMSWHFDSSNITLSLILSPYLVQQTSEYRYAVLRLDKLDTRWAEMVPTVDVLIVGVGAQFVQPALYMVRDDVVGCYSCQSLSSYLDTTNLKEISLYSGFRATMRSSIMGIGALPGFEGAILFLQPFGFESKVSYFGVSLKMKDIQLQELKKARTRRTIYNQSKWEVLHTNLDSMGKYDPIKAQYSPICSIPRPLADMWNQVLQHTLTRILTVETDN